MAQVGAIEQDLVGAVLRAKKLVKKHKLQSDYHAYLTMYNDTDIKTSVYGVISLWMLGYKDKVRLMWWKSEDPMMRKICFALITHRKYDFMLAVEERKIFFRYAQRFGSKEAEIRRLEMEKVLKDRDGYKRLLHFAWYGIDKSGSK